jgi:RNA polymerase sigma factor (sigma-70 family)
MPEANPRWSLTERALETLLRRLGEDREAAAREYDAVRRKLIGFFRRRDAPAPEALADEVIDRVARRLEEGETIEHLNAFFYGVAKRVMMEWTRRRMRQRAAEQQLPGDAAPAVAVEDVEREEARSACLEECLKSLGTDSRRLIVSYYQGDLEKRKLLAVRLGMSYTGLKSQAHRIRVRLGTCIQQCLTPGEGCDR